MLHISPAPVIHMSAFPQRCAHIMCVQPCHLQKHIHISMLSWVCERQLGEIAHKSSVMRTDGLCLLYIPGGCLLTALGADKVITNNVQIAAPQCDNYANAERESEDECE